MFIKIFIVTVVWEVSNLISKFLLITVRKIYIYKQTQEASSASSAIEFFPPIFTM